MHGVIGAKCRARGANAGSGEGTVWREGGKDNSAGDNTITEDYQAYCFTHSSPNGTSVLGPRPCALTFFWVNIWDNKDVLR
jgi:hypothetical protein